MTEDGVRRHAGARKVAGTILAAAVYAVTILLALYVTRICLAYPQTDETRYHTLRRLRNLE